MPTDWIFVANGPDASYERRVGISTGSDSSARLVKISKHSEPGVMRVLVVKSDPDEWVRVENPGDLPFEIKVDLFGPPPCPVCGYTMRYLTAFILGCDRCRGSLPDYKLEIEYIGRVWAAGRSGWRR